MALAPASQFCPTALLDSLHTSFSRLQPPCLLPLFRHPSASPSKKLHFYIKSIQPHNPEAKSPPSIRPNSHNHQVPSDDLSTKPTWIQNWTETRVRPLPKHPRAVVDYRKGISSDEDEVGTSRSTGSSTMEKIVEKLKKFGYIDDTEERNERPLPEKGSVEDIFYVEDGILPDSRGGLSLDLSKEVRFPWEKPLEGEGRSLAQRNRSKTSLAELTLPEGELRRLRHLAIRTKSKTKIRGAGVTREIVEAIHEKWMTTEVVRLKVEGPPALNMKRMHEILERKTGGLVIWRSGTSISLYRGLSYEIPQPVKKPYRSIQSTGVGSYNKTDYNSASVPSVSDGYSNMQDTHEGATTPVERKKDTKPEVKYEYEVDKLLDSLGSRYTDWPGCDPLPVDADLLPGVVPGYKPPFRILPYGVRSSLGLKEGTALRRLARVLPPHFALGRSRQHQGLAAAIVKLWEKSSVAKITFKRGVQLTSSERMAEDIKKLTGGSILSRNKDYLVFYRGKDFLSPEVTEALLERERIAKSLQDEEEKARLRASSSVVSNIEAVEESGTAGTLGETLEADARWGNRLGDDHKNMMMKAAEVARHADVVRKLERKLSFADHKLMKAERALAKVEEFLKPVERNTDPDSITDEERFMFRKLGLKMKAYLLLGRRGVFDGTVENMHLHWKYRELVKVIMNAKTFRQVKNVALSLEAESGGVLVSVDKISKGFAMIVYRGKDYQRPPTLRPKNLLTKRKALARSIELQRLEALSSHVSTLRKRVELLKSELEQMENVEGRGDEDLYAKLDSAYSSEDEESEDEGGDDAYLESYDSAADANSDEDGEGDSSNIDDDGHEDGEASNYDNDEDDDDDDDDDDNPVDNILVSMNTICDHQSGTMRGTLTD